MMAAGSTTYLALGDSYTIGEGVATANSWPERLSHTLQAQGHPLRTPTIIACTGWTTDELHDAIRAHSLQPPYALVSLLIGVNNQYRGRDTDHYRDEFEALLQHAIELAGHQSARVMAISIPDWGVTPFAHDDARSAAQIAGEIDSFNTIAQHEAARADVAFVDITGISRACSGDPAMFAEDGLHPSGAQYAHWLPPILAAASVCLATTSSDG